MRSSVEQGIPRQNRMPSGMRTKLEVAYLQHAICGKITAFSTEPCIPYGMQVLTLFNKVIFPIC